MKPKTYWAEFMDGKLSTEPLKIKCGYDDYRQEYLFRWVDSPILFTRRKDAKLYFDDVRNVEIREVKNDQ